MEYRLRERLERYVVRNAEDLLDHLGDDHRAELEELLLEHDERRAQILACARRLFSERHYDAVPTEEIAREAGVARGLLHHYFGTKRELFLSVVEQSFDRLQAALTEAAESSDPGSVLPALEAAFERALTAGDGELLQMQLYAACGEEEVRLAVRRRFGECYRYVERASGASADEVRALFGRALLRSVAASIGVPDLAGREAWAQRLLDQA
jgi:AcrR family transcriptional regulator